MVTNMKSKWLWAPLAALVLWTVPAQAEKPSTPPRIPSAEERAKQVSIDQARFKDHQERRAQLEKTPGTGPWLSRTRPVASNEVEVRVEGLRDGALLYSTPTEKYQEKYVREVKTREEVQHNTLFQGRYYRQVRAAARVEWEKMIGKNVLLRLETQGGSMGSLAVSAKIK
jgi:hypothetical protein